MNIGIMTWFHYPNYGTALQVFALCKYLEERNNTVKVIQYYPNPEPMYYSSKFDEYLYRGKRKLYTILSSPNIVEETSGDLFRKFLLDSISFTGKVASDKDLDSLNFTFDCFICGSDQIWSPLNFDPHYYLDFVKDPEKMIAYAPSIGVFQIESPEYRKEISELTNRFKYLSVREKTGADLIKRLNGKDARVVLDPTLLLNKDYWNRYIPGSGEGKYLLAYFLRENKRYWKVVKTVAKKLHLDVKVIPVFEDDLKMPGAQRGVGPDELVKLFRGASFICTDSFHGMAFSVNFNKQFLPFKRFASSAKDNQNSRVYDFLESVGLKDRMYRGGEVNKYLRRIDYGPVNSRLETLREESREYLDGALKEIKIDS